MKVTIVTSLSGKEIFRFSDVFPMSYPGLLGILLGSADSLAPQSRAAYWNPNAYDVKRDDRARLSLSVEDNDGNELVVMSDVIEAVWRINQAMIIRPGNYLAADLDASGVEKLFDGDRFLPDLENAEQIDSNTFFLYSDEVVDVTDEVNAAFRKDVEFAHQNFPEDEISAEELLSKAKSGNSDEDAYLELLKKQLEELKKARLMGSLFDNESF